MTERRLIESGCYSRLVDRSGNCSYLNVTLDVLNAINELNRQRFAVDIFCIDEFHPVWCLVSPPQIKWSSWVVRKNWFLSSRESFSSRASVILLWQAITIWSDCHQLWREGFNRKSAGTTTSTFINSQRTFRTELTFGNQNILINEMNVNEWLWELWRGDNTRVMPTMRVV